jgi:hypothetical protein
LSGNGLGGKIGAHGRASYEADCESDANVGQCSRAVCWRRYVGYDGTIARCDVMRNNQSRTAAN